MSTQSDKLRKSKVAKYIPEKSSNKNVENCHYPGFKVKQLSELPRHLDAADLWDLVIKAQNFKKAVFKVWRKLFLSEASIAVFQDSFWWWFLQQFKTNQEDQDHLFDRIADSFVGLFLCVPRNTKDAFFQVYPDCLSQVIYVAFCEAFPESTTYFGDEFKDELVDLIFQWVSGLKPQKFVWKKWNLDCLKKTTVNGNEKDTITRSTVKESIKSKPVVQGLRFQLGFCWEDLIEGRKSMFASSTEEIKEDRKHAVAVPKESETITKSCYFGPGPHFRRVLFRLGGQSPLISYYLKMHEITNVSNSLTYKMKRTEIYKLPYPFEL
ncbi:protein FAM227B [Alligator mississippiensis]|uniref:protein FAM227B n=1 Tax=Alligator mississippiensis TaxID=8496 RepID=UPI0009071143|nr:protein FAM227B [Alligator mississippiensis]